MKEKKTRNLILAVALLIAATGANAQSPRTPDGHPDFSGTYDIATLTPIVRPANVGGRASLTDAEANILAKCRYRLVGWRVIRSHLLF